MSGYQTVLEVRRLEADLDKLGLMMCYPKHGGWGSSSREDYVAVKPKDTESLPIYSRDAELFCGTLRDLRSWLIGIEWARSYDMLLRLSDEKKREKREQAVRNENLLRRIKNEEVFEKTTA